MPISRVQDMAPLITDAERTKRWTAVINAVNIVAIANRRAAITGTRPLAPEELGEVDILVEWLLLAAESIAPGVLDRLVVGEDTQGLAAAARAVRDKMIAGRTSAPPGSELAERNRSPA